MHTVDTNLHGSNVVDDFGNEVWVMRFGRDAWLVRMYLGQEEYEVAMSELRGD